MAPDDVTNLRKLLAGRIDLFPIDQEVGQYLIARNFPPRLAQQLEPQSKSFCGAAACGDLAQASPGPELVERFNRGLKALQDSGEFERLVADTRAASLAYHRPIRMP